MRHLYVSAHAAEAAVLLRFQIAWIGNIERHIQGCISQQQSYKANQVHVGSSFKAMLQVRAAGEEREKDEDVQQHKGCTCDQCSLSMFL